MSFDPRSLLPLFEAAIAAEAILDRALETGDEPAIERATAADRRARDLVDRALAAIGGPGDVAVIAPDGTLFARATQADGLAVVPPDRVIRLEG